MTTRAVAAIFRVTRARVDQFDNRVLAFVEDDLRRLRDELRE
jgi:hypothetical protein